MAHWLFYVERALVRFGGWDKAVCQNLAAQEYSSSEPGERQNIRLLEQIRKGDWLVAGRAVRFAGYAEAVSDFYRGGPSLNVVFKRGGQRFPMRERVDVHWHLVPGYEHEKNWLDLHDFKDELLQDAADRGESVTWSEIDFRPGRCVWPIGKSVFEEVRRRLDAAGARRVKSR